MMEGLTYFPMAVFGEEVRRFYHKMTLFRSLARSVYFYFYLLVRFVGSLLGIDPRGCISRCLKNRANEKESYKNCTFPLQSVRGLPTALEEAMPSCVVIHDGVLGVFREKQQAA